MAFSSACCAWRPPSGGTALENELGDIEVVLRLGSQSSATGPDADADSGSLIDAATLSHGRPLEVPRIRARCEKRSGSVKPTSKGTGAVTESCTRRFRSMVAGSKDGSTTRRSISLSPWSRSPSLSPWSSPRSTEPYNHTASGSRSATT